MTVWNGMQAEKGMKMFSRKKEVPPAVLMPGDIVAVNRSGGRYQHFGVYIGRGRVVHYSPKTSDFSLSDPATVCLVSFERFLNGDRSYCVLRFTADGGHIYDGPHDPSLDRESPLEKSIRKARGYHLYSPEETVNRALSRLGESRYDILTNNCEHFAIWCKTGVSDSYQLNLRAESLLSAIPMMIAIAAAPSVVISVSPITM